MVKESLTVILLKSNGSWKLNHSSLLVSRPLMPSCLMRVTTSMPISIPKGASALATCAKGTFSAFRVFGVIFAQAPAAVCRKYGYQQADCAGNQRWEFFIDHRQCNIRKGTGEYGDADEAQVLRISAQGTMKLKPITGMMNLRRSASRRFVCR